MNRILIVTTAVALAAIGYGHGTALWGTADHLGSDQYLTTVGFTAIATDGSMPFGLFYLCAEDAATGEASSKEEEPSEPVPGIDRTWNVVMYG